MDRNAVDYAIKYIDEAELEMSDKVKALLLIEVDGNQPEPLMDEIQKVLEVKNGQHPWLLRDYLAKNVSLETLCIMDEIIGFTTDWERLISEKVVYPDVHIKIRKYKTFVSVDHKKFKNILLDACS